MFARVSARPGFFQVFFSSFFPGPDRLFDSSLRTSGVALFAFSLCDVVSILGVWRGRSVVIMVDTCGGQHEQHAELTDDFNVFLVFPCGSHAFVF